MTNPTAKSTNPLIPLRQFWTPRFWLTWLGIGFMYVAAYLPFFLQLKLGKLIGILAYHLARGRRHVCETNISICFPELDGREQQSLVRRTFVANGIGFIEVCMAWCGNRERYRNRVTVHGLDNLQGAQAKGRGVLLIGPHLTSFEMGGCLTSLFIDVHVTYSRNEKNPLFEAFMVNGRRRLYKGVFERKDVRGAMRSLREGGILWYATDHDFGVRHSVFVPFFGRLAATMTAGSRFAKFNNSPVVFFSSYRKADNSGYEIHFSPELTDFPSGDDETDGRIINRLVEEAIRKQPDQYLWLHKRFKTPPPGTTENPY